MLTGASEKMKAKQKSVRKHEVQYDSNYVK